MYQNDQWNITDDLGMEKAGDGLAKMTLEVDAPFTIAVTGKWGAGKTSVMRRAFATLGGSLINQTVPLQRNKQEASQSDWYKPSVLRHPDIDTNDDAERLRDERKDELAWSEATFNVAENSHCIWYSPWQHQNAENPLIPLLLEIQNHFLLRYQFKEGAKTYSRKAGLAAMTLLERVGDMALSLNGKKPALAGTTEAVKNAWQSTANHLTQLSDGQRFHLLFEDAIETALQGLSKDDEIQEKDRIVIFIDDLDRCEGSTVVMLLEAIKLYLGTQRCVFVLGLDSTAILSALDHHWENRSEDHNREYLEKLFQATVRVPAPSTVKVQQMLETQFMKHGVPTPDLYAEQITTLLEPNPRKLKNFANSFCAIWVMHKIPADDLQIRRLVLFLYLNLYHPAVWRILERQPWSLRILSQVLNATSNELPPLPENINKENQRIMEYFFSQAFSHVLRQDGSGDDDKHYGLALEKAVNLFLDRIDRKCSDEYFISLAAEAFSIDDQVDEHFLSIVTTTQQMNSNENSAEST